MKSRKKISKNRSKTRKIRKTQKGGLLPLFLISNAVPMILRSGPTIAYIGSGLVNIGSKFVKYTVEVGDSIDKVDKVMNAKEIFGKIIDKGKSTKKNETESK